MTDYCKLCAEKITKREGEALFYCIKCGEQTKEG